MPTKINSLGIALLGVMSVFCIGFIFGPLAIISARKAMKAVDEGTPIDALQRGQIQFGMMMGWMGIVVWVLLAIGFIKLSTLGH